MKISRENDNSLSLMEIVEILFVEFDVPLTICSLFRCVRFKEHFHAYVIEKKFLKEKEFVLRPSSGYKINHLLNTIRLISVILSVKLDY